MRAEQHNSHVWAQVFAAHHNHIGDYAWWLASRSRSIFSTKLDDTVTIDRDRYNRDDLNTRTNWDLP